MCFARKPGLGHYHGSRRDWRKAYRSARIAARDGLEPDPATSGIVWKARLIVAYDRSQHIDPLSFPVSARLESKRLIDEIINGSP